MVTALLDGTWEYEGDTFKIIMTRYSDPDRLNAARNAAIYLGKSDISNVRRPLKIIELGHVAEIFKGEFAEFKFHGVSKEVYDHLVTYRLMQMRVAGGNRALKSDGYNVPSDMVKNEWHVVNAIDRSMTNYKNLLEMGETPQVARSAMPIAAKMNTFVMQFNFLHLMQSVFRQRIWEKGAQNNTVKVVEGMWRLVHSVDPELWDTAYEWFGTPSIEWVEVRRKLRNKKVTVSDLLKALPEGCEDKSLEDILRRIYGDQKSMW